MVKENRNKLPLRLSIAIKPSWSDDITYLYCFDITNKKKHFLEWYRRLETMKKKDYDYLPEIPDIEQIDDIPYPQFIGDLYNLMYGALICSIFSALELDIKFLSETNGFKIMKMLEKIKEDYGVDYEKISKYSQIKELNRLNNDYKHNGRVYNGYKNPLRLTVFGGVEEIDYSKQNIPQILADCETFLTELSDGIGKARNKKRNLKRKS